LSKQASISTRRVKPGVGDGGRGAGGSNVALGGTFVGCSVGKGSRVAVAVGIAVDEGEGSGTLVVSVRKGVIADGLDLVAVASGRVGPSEVDRPVSESL